MIETDKQGGFKLALRDELKTGVYKGFFPSAAPLWAEGENVQFTQSGVRKMFGWDLLADTGNGEPIRGVLQQTENNLIAVYAGDLSNLYRSAVPSEGIEIVGSGYSIPENAGSTEWDGGATTWDDGATVWDNGAVPAGQWSFVDYGTFVLATNGIDTPQIRKGVGRFVSMVRAVTYVEPKNLGSGYTAGDIVNLTGGDGAGAQAEIISVDGAGAVASLAMYSGGANYTTPPTGVSGGTGTGLTIQNAVVTEMSFGTCEIFQKRGPHILAFGTNFSSREVAWCDADNPDDWITRTTNLAGTLEIRELKSPIRAAVPLGSRIAIYGDDQVFLLSYLGNELVFGYQPALNGIGAVSKSVVVLLSYPLVQGTTDYPKTDSLSLTVPRLSTSTTRSGRGSKRTPQPPSYPKPAPITTRSIRKSGGSSPRLT